MCVEWSVVVVVIVVAVVVVAMRFLLHTKYCRKCTSRDKEREREEEIEGEKCSGKLHTARDNETRRSSHIHKYTSKYQIKKSNTEKVLKKPTNSNKMSICERDLRAIRVKRKQNANKRQFTIIEKIKTESNK